MDKKKYWITRMFLILFTVSVSMAVLPSGIINVRGLFGEVSASVIVEDKDQETENIKSRYHESIQRVKGINIINPWFELLMMVVCIGYRANLTEHPPGDTIVTLRVRMNN